jgi:hypothetical protein
MFHNGQWTRSEIRLGGHHVAMLTQAGDFVLISFEFLVFPLPGASTGTSVAAACSVVALRT